MYLLFDIGGTRMRWSLSKDGMVVGEPVILETPQNFEEAMSLIKKTVQEMIGNASIEKTAGGIRRLNETKEKLLPDFRLPDWSGKPLRERLEEITGNEVFLENDTALVGLGEAVEGAGKGHRIVAYLTVSTGVGGARIVDKKIDANSFGFEPGHQVIDMDWSKFPELKKLENEGYGQLEAYISGSSLERRFAKKPKEITDESVWDETAKILSFALKNTIVYWSPDVIVLGGGMMGVPGISIRKLKAHLESNLKIFTRVPEIKKAQLGDGAGLYGALTFIKQIQG